MHPVSSAFHGRDVFSPVAAHLAAGADLGDLGEGVTPASMVSLGFPGFRREPDGCVAAEIINIDRFGNARLSVMQEDLDLSYGTPLKIGVRDEVVEARYVETFGPRRTATGVVPTPMALSFAGTRQRGPSPSAIRRRRGRLKLGETANDRRSASPFARAR